MKFASAALISLFLWPGFGSTLMSARAAETQTSPSRQTLYLGQQIYQVNCAVCHGVEGDGNGPAASMFRIRPRDFRTGIFKFRSTPSGSLPTDDDLLRTVTQGVRWTGMIGRPDLGGKRSEGRMIQYIETFSPRFVKERPGKLIGVPAAPPKTQEILDQGKRLYKESGCNACHGEQGRGDGSIRGRTQGRLGLADLAVGLDLAPTQARI